MKLKPNTHKKITKYLGVSKQVCDTFKEMTGYDTELVYNPIKIDKPKKVLNLISATRLTKEKGKDRIIKLSKLLDEAKIPYLWTIFTDDVNAIKNPNIIYMKPRLDIIGYMANADYLVQLSDNEGYCYSVVESLTIGTPVIVTEVPVFKEIGVKDGENGFILDFELSTVPVENIYKGLPKFEYKPKEDNWKYILEKGKSTYKEEREMKVKVKCIRNYLDMQLNKNVTTDDEPFVVDYARAEELVNAKVCEIVEKIEEPEVDGKKVVEYIKQQEEKPKEKKTIKSKKK